MMHNCILIKLNQNQPKNKDEEGASPKKKKWWKRLAPKKRRSSPPPRIVSSHTPNMDFGEHELVFFLSIKLIGSVPSIVRGMRLHLFEPQ